jgi:iron complex outermembrane receptor protein
VSYPIPQLGKKGEVFVMVENLFNQQYSYRQGYPMPGTWGSIGLATSF